MNLWTIFLTGLFTGGLTCLAVQGGLLATTIAQRKGDELVNQTKSGNALPIIFFLAAKLFAYTILGFLLGWFGSLFQLSFKTTIILQLLVGVFMLGTAFNLLGVHPIFRYFIIQPPRFLFRFIRGESKSKDFFAPAILGFFTVFLPCGTTQAMMALAIASGNPILGATILFVFVLGTSPLFFTLGYFATRMGDFFSSKFVKAAALTVIFLAVLNINTAMALTGSNLTLGNIGNQIYCSMIAFCDSGHVKGISADASNELNIDITNRGYTPQDLVVKAGSDVTLKVRNINGGGCQQSLVIPYLGFQKVIRPGNSDTIQFKAPSTPTEIAFMCGMNMFRGRIRVV